MNRYIAQQPVEFGDPITGIGKIGLFFGDAPVNILAAVLSLVTGLLTVIGIIYFMFNLIIGAIGIISAGGDKAAFANARGKITTGFIGIVAVIAAMFIIDLFAYIMGLEGFLNLAEMINAIKL